ncbi:cuticular protein RR-1 motif 12 precursor [Danaus plexippus plexippus]|uniref:Cuticular protein RR-1 motif 12 n=1 Tax=Danaus plexippus plexippus TaxID=278856 RepID=A0A212F6G4_DANPL|nr:cuticular protein RR-1 motif 12 precursor [Danaus plexippus plexippus]
MESRILVLSIIAYGYADKLDKGYLPPVNAASSGGSPAELIAPADQSEVFGQGLPVPESQPGSYIQDIGQEVLQAYNQERPQAAADRNAEILKFNNENNGESYAYNYETSNGISVEESGVASNGVNAQGGYAYTGDDGKSYSVTYTADINGYQPQGEHLPTPHPIPEEILKSIEENARAAAAGTQEGAYNPEEYDSNVYYQTKPDQESDGSLDVIERNKNQEISSIYNNPLDSVGQQYQKASSLDVNPSDQKRNKESGQDINQMYTPNPYQSHQTSGIGIQGNSGFESSSQSPIQGIAGQFLQGDGYQYNQPKFSLQPVFPGQDQYKPQVTSDNENISSSLRPSSSGPAFNRDQNLKPSFGSLPSAEQTPQYQSGQQILPEFRPSSHSGPNASQSMRGSVPNQDQQIQIKESSGDLNESKGNGYHYNQPKPVFQPANSEQSSLNQYRPELSGQSEKISSSSRPGLSGSIYNGDQNLKPSFGSLPPADQSSQYQSGQQILPEFRPSSHSGPNASQNMKGSLPNQDQQIQIKESSGDLNESKGNGYHYNQPKPVFQPANSEQSSLNQYRPELSGQSEKISSSSRPGLSGSIYNGDQNLKPSFGSLPPADQSSQYQSGQQILPEFRPSSHSGPNASQNMRGSLPNQDQQIQIKESSGDLNESKGNGYHYNQPKPAFQPANSEQSSLNQYRPELSGQSEKISSSSRPGLSGSIYNGDQNLKPSFGSLPPADQSSQYQSGQQILPEFRPSSHSGPNASQNMKGSLPNQDQQIQIKESSGDLNESKGNGYHYNQPKPAFQPANSGQSSFNQYRPELSGQSEKISSSARPSMSIPIFNRDQNLKPSFGSRPSADQSQKYQFGKQIPSVFKPSSYRTSNVSQNKESPFLNRDQRVQIKRPSSGLIQNKVNGYQYNRPKPAFQPTISGQNRPRVSNEGNKKPLLSQNTFTSVVSGNNGNINPSPQNGPNGSQNKGSYPIKVLKNPGSQAAGSSQGNGSPRFSILNKNKPYSALQKPGQGFQSSPSEGLGNNKFGKGPISALKQVEAPYHYKRPSVSFTTQRPNSFSQTTQISRGNQDKSEQFAGSRPPPSFSEEEGYKY